MVTTDLPVGTRLHYIGPPSGIFPDTPRDAVVVEPPPALGMYGAIMDSTDECLWIEEDGEKGKRPLMNETYWEVAGEETV